MPTRRRPRFREKPVSSLVPACPATFCGFSLASAESHDNSEPIAVALGSLEPWARLEPDRDGCLRVRRRETELPFRKKVNECWVFQLSQKRKKESERIMGCKTTDVRLVGKSYYDKIRLLKTLKGV